MLFFILTFAIVSIAALITYIWWSVFRRKYTRERFAFQLLLSNTAVVLLVINVFTSTNYWLIGVNYILVNVFGKPQIQSEEPGISEMILALILVLYYLRKTSSIHTNWNGAKSKVEQNSVNIPDTHSFLIDAYRYMRYEDARRISISENSNHQEEFTVQSMTVESISWRLQLADLLKLISTQYKINVESDWYSQENCYISRYGNDNHVIAIFCTHTEVADAKVSGFVNFVQRQRKNCEISYIWGIRDGKETGTREINGAEIKIVTENSLLDELIDFSDYKRYIIRRFEKEQIYDGNPLSLDDIYVEPKCSMYDAVTKKHSDLDSVESYVSDWLNDELQHKQLALLGEYGQGKSVLSLRLAYLILTGKISSKRIPVIIDLRGRFIKQYNDPIEILSSWALYKDMNIKALMKLHNAGRLLLIFEGFDELDLIGDKEIRKEHFRKIWEFSISKSKIIITGRPNYFLDDQEMITLLRLSQQLQDGSKYCESIVLKPFNKEQINKSLRKLSSNVREEILRVYEEQPETSSFRDLVSRPSLLFLTGLIWEKENLASRSNSINSAAVIKAFLMYSYKRQDDKSPNGQGFLMSSDERAYFMQGVAVAMVRKFGYTNIITSKDLESIVYQLLKDFPLQISKLSPNSNKKKLQNRLDKNHIVEAIQTDIRSCGVLVKDLSSKDSFCFAHKSFMELLVADFISDYYLIRNNSEKDLRWVKTNGIVKALNIRPDDLVLHRNVLNFIVELLSARMELKDVDSKKDQVLSVYKQLAFYPVSIKFLGLFMKCFGIHILISIIMLVEFVFMGVILFVFARYNGMSVINSILLCLSSILASCILTNFVSSSKTSRKIFFRKDLERISALTRLVLRRPELFTLLQNTKICIFYLVCKNRHIEQALDEIWPKGVVQRVSKTSEIYIRNEQRISKDNTILTMGI